MQATKKRRSINVSLTICLLSSLYGYGQAPQWNIDAGDFQYSMNLTAAYFTNCQWAGQLEDTVAAFAGEELRGVAPVSEVINQVAISYLTVFSNNPSGETISFRFYNKASDQVISLKATAEFREGRILGGRSAPFELYEVEPSVVAPVIEVENDSIYLASTDTHYDTYQWFKDGQPMVGKTDLFLKPDQSGSYSLEITTAGGCSAASNAVSIEIVVTSIDDEDLGGVRIYPVPFKDSFNLLLPEGGAEPYVLSIHNLQGAEVLKRKLSGRKAVHTIDGLGHIPGGIYSVRLMNGGNIKSYRVIKN